MGMSQSTNNPQPPGAWPQGTSSQTPQEETTGAANAPNPPMIRGPSVPTEASRSGGRVDQAERPIIDPSEPRQLRPVALKENRQSSFSSALSYFLPIRTPDITHGHFLYNPAQIRLTTVYLSRRLPVDLIPRILDHAEYWSGCMRECKRDVRVMANAIPPRQQNRGGGGRWLSGQEDEIDDDEKEGLKDESGKCWYLVSEKIGCVERYDLSVDSLDRHDPSQSGQQPLVEDTLESRVTTQEKRSVWIREVVIKMNSKDQGWSSDGHHNYGEFQAHHRG